jgi:hypothetical protein
MGEIDIQGWKELQRALKRVDPELQKSMNHALRDEAQVIADEAKQFAVWSERIPGAITARVNTHGGEIVVSRRKAPHGSLYELGSKGNRGQIRHPVFGNRENWVSQPTRPFIRPAINYNRAHFNTMATRIMLGAIRKAGL